MDARKHYRFTARWGEARATDDAEGDIIASSEKRPSIAEIETVLAQFTGEIDQVPPQFSAIKVGGERAYDLARDGEMVKLESRKVMIYELRVIDTPSADETVFEAITGKGAYVRALVRDLAHLLGTEGYVSELRRLAVGPLRAEDGITLAALEAMETMEERDSALLPILGALTGMPQAAVDGPQADRLRRGQEAILSPAVAKGVRGDISGAIEGVLAVLHDEAVAICELDGLKLKPGRVFNA